MILNLSDDQNLAISTIASMGYTIAIMEDRVLECAEFLEAEGRQNYHNIIARDITKMLNEQHVLSAVSSHKTLAAQATYGGTLDSASRNPHSDAIVTALNDIKQLKYKYHHSCQYKLVMNR